MREDIDREGITTIATTPCLAVDDHLGGQSYVRPLSAPDNVDPVSNGTGGALGPAAAAVSRDMLIFGP